uniref:Uncharacterized protein n=1 Tax=Romanomermis culicivorax TaxID=13658 RepID=A0A915K2X5_ROMCU
MEYETIFNYYILSFWIQNFKKTIIEYTSRTLDEAALQSTIKDLGGASVEDIVTPGLEECFFVEGMSDLDLLFELEGKEDEEGDED